MKIALIGSSQYWSKFKEVERRLMEEGCEVRIPAFDHHEFNELGIFEYNRTLIEWADRVHIIWDGRSLGTIFDFGMTFALRKSIVIEYLEPKTFTNGMRQYEQECQMTYQAEGN